MSDCIYARRWIWVVVCVCVLVCILPSHVYAEPSAVPTAPVETGEAQGETEASPKTAPTASAEGYTNPWEEKTLAEKTLDMPIWVFMILAGGLLIILVYKVIEAVKLRR